MTNTQDIRWEQRFSNYVKALDKLSQAVDFINQQNEKMNIIPEDILIEGVIQRFEYTHELAWNVMKDFAEWQGNFSIKGSRDATREAFQIKLISEGAVWMDMIKSRNDTSHTYDEETANSIYHKIISNYYPAFLEFRNIMENLRSGKQEDLFKNE